MRVGDGAAAIVAAVRADPGLLRENAHDPLRNGTVGLFASRARALKTVLLLPLACARIACYLVVFSSAGASAYLGAVCPVGSGSRSFLFAAATTLVRAGLFCQGYHRVAVVGAAAARSAAPVVVPNHVSYVEVRRSRRPSSGARPPPPARRSSSRTFCGRAAWPRRSSATCRASGPSSARSASCFSTRRRRRRGRRRSRRWRRASTTRARPDSSASPRARRQTGPA